MSKKIDKDTLERAVRALWNDYSYSLGKAKLYGQENYQLAPGESPQDSCFLVRMNKNTPDDYKNKLPREFEGYKVFYHFKADGKPTAQ